MLSFCKEGYLAFPAAVSEPINSRVSSFLEVLTSLTRATYTELLIVFFTRGPPPVIDCFVW